MSAEADGAGDVGDVRLEVLRKNQSPQVAPPPPHNSLKPCLRGGVRGKGRVRKQSQETGWTKSGNGWVQVKKQVGSCQEICFLVDAEKLSLNPKP